MAKLIQTIKNIVHCINDLYDERDRQIDEWRETDLDSYFNYIITNKEVY